MKIRKLEKSFGKLDVLKGLDLDLEKAGITAVLGPNGSGKTTLIKCMLGMVIPDRGQILFMGRPVQGKWEYRHQVGYLPQISRFPDNLSPNELIRFIKKLRQRPSFEQPLLDRFELHPFMGKRLGALSGGTRQKVNLVLAFMYDCPLLVLDEPTAGLDPLGLIELKNLLREEREKGKTLLVTTHVLDFVEEMADEIAFLLDGRVYFEGKPEVLKERFRAGRLDQAIAALLKRAKPQNGQLKHPLPMAARDMLIQGEK